MTRRPNKYSIAYGLIVVGKAAAILILGMLLIYGIGWLWSGGRVD